MRTEKLKDAAKALKISPQRLSALFKKHPEWYTDFNIKRKTSKSAKIKLHSIRGNVSLFEVAKGIVLDRNIIIHVETKGSDLTQNDLILIDSENKELVLGKVKLDKDLQLFYFEHINDKNITFPLGDDLPIHGKVLGYCYPDEIEKEIVHTL